MNQVRNGGVESTETTALYFSRKNIMVNKVMPLVRDRPYILGAKNTHEDKPKNTK